MQNDNAKVKNADAGRQGNLAYMAFEWFPQFCFLIFDF